MKNQLGEDWIIERGGECGARGLEIGAGFQAFE